MKVGDKLWYEVFSRNAPTVIKECEIEKVGTKYYTVKRNSWQEWKVDKVKLRHEDKVYSQHSVQFYKSIQEIEDRRESSRLRQEIKDAPMHTLTLSQLRRINDIINE